MATAIYNQGCYLADWAIYRPEPYKFSPHNIPVGLCTHIFYAFAALNVTTFEAEAGDEYADISLKGFDGLNALKKKQPGLKTILSFGGWTESQTGIYSTLASDPAKISAFVKSAWAMADKYGFDGVDLDWEYPAAADRFNYIDLIRELKTSGGGRLVTAAVPAETEDMIGYNVPAIEEYIDLFNVMTYDYSGSDAEQVDHHSSYSKTLHTLAIWNQRGAPKSKLMLGIPAYGVGWIADQCLPGWPTKGPAPAQPVSQEDSNAAYFELVKMSGETIESADGPYLATRTRRGEKVCYGFDNVASVNRKMAYVRAQGYAGAFTWTVDFDDAAFALHRAIQDGLTTAP